MTRLEKITWGLVAAFLAYLYMVYRDQTPTVTIDPRSLGDRQYDPFSHWRHDHPKDYYRPYPLVVGPNVLPLIYQSQDHGLALEVNCPDGSSYPQ
jgi:hypothetical protein